MTDSELAASVRLAIIDTLEPVKDDMSELRVTQTEMLTVQKDMGGKLMMLHEGLKDVRALLDGPKGLVARMEVHENCPARLAYAVEQTANQNAEAIERARKHVRNNPASSLRPSRRWFSSEHARLAGIVLGTAVAAAAASYGVTQATAAPQQAPAANSAVP